MIYPSKHISVSIDRKPSEVYEFLSKPNNLPQWASGLSHSTLQKDGDYWVTDSPMGSVKIKFCDKNKLGVVDHDVILPSGEINHNPMRVLKNGVDCEVVFTLYRRPRMSDEDFKKDSDFIIEDLDKLKSILEKK